MLGPFATASRFTLSFTRCRYCLHCRTPPAHRCPRRRRRQRQRVTEGTAMAPWNGPNRRFCICLYLICVRDYNCGQRSDLSVCCVRIVSDRCALYCAAKGADGERMYRRFSDDVEDGTPCNGAPNSVCINGTCQVRQPCATCLPRIATRRLAEISNHSC